MLQKTEGIVLRSFKIRENSLIVDIFTKEFGLRSYIIPSLNAKKGGSIMAYFQPLETLDLVVYEKESQHLQRIKEFKLAGPMMGSPSSFDISKISICIFCAEVFKYCLKEKSQNLTLYQTCYDLIKELKTTTEKLTIFPQYFLLKLSKGLGICPDQRNFIKGCLLDLREGIFTPNEPIHPDFMNPLISEFTFKILNSLDSYENFDVSKQFRMQWLFELLRYFDIHVPQFQQLKSLPILNNIMLETK